jgi:redox-sensitive bicupin YhaK (pirin superfamily)
MTSVEVIAAREVPLGGPRAMTVHRTLPSRGRTTIGAWCFIDHYGPSEVAATGGMRVPPHPHTGLQTVSWLFSGEIEHRDSVGSHALVRPGTLNLMTAGRGISHSEVSTAATAVLHGVQLWVALPDDSRSVEPFFESHDAVTVPLGDGSASVFVGDFAGASVAARAFTPLVAAEIVLPAGGRATLTLTSGFEYGILVDEGPVTVSGVTVERTELAYAAAGHPALEIVAAGGPARLLLIGGEPFGEELLMWWNFVGRSHDEIVAFRAAWQAESGSETAETASSPASAAAPSGASAMATDARRFGETDHRYTGRPLPAPVLPGVRLQPRR